MTTTARGVAVRCRCAFQGQQRGPERPHYIPLFFFPSKGGFLSLLSLSPQSPPQAQQCQDSRVSDLHLLPPKSSTGNCYYTWKKRGLFVAKTMRKRQNSARSFTCVSHIVPLTNFLLFFVLFCFAKGKCGFFYTLHFSWIIHQLGSLANEYKNYILTLYT